MRKLIILLLLLVLPASVPAGEFPDIEGWKPEGEVNIHRRNDLWQYINGAAEMFLMYDFQMLRFREFSRKGMEMTIEIYDMATPLNAFGIYTTERGDDEERFSIGTEAVVVPPYYCQLLKGRFYVKVNMQQGVLDSKAGEAILRSIDSSVEGASRFPDELNLLPERGKISGSEKYIAKGYRAMGELNNVLFADYHDAKGKEYRYFLMLPSTDETVDDKWKNLSGKWTSVTEKGHTILYRDIPYSGKVGVVRKGKRIIGISDVMEMREMLDRLTEIR
jgi:hypothetical protein